MDHIQEPLPKGLKDGSITVKMKDNLVDANNITLALYGIQQRLPLPCAIKDFMKCSSRKLP